MTFFCNGCEKERNFDSDYGMYVITAQKQVRRICRLCRSPKAFMPDVFWDGKPEENLADDPVTGHPRVFISKGQKAAYLKERGLQEAGDPVHGAPISFAGQPSSSRDSRHEVKMALKQVKEMGKDVRRQAYWKIIKENAERFNVQ